MKNKDALALEKAKIVERMNEAIAANDTDAFAAAFEELCGNIQDVILAEARAINADADASVLASRGVRQLTSEERKYYEKVIEAMRTENPRQALSELDVVMPKTTFDWVFEDLQTEHELLSKIHFQNTAGMIEIIVNTNGVELASWSGLVDAITKELTSGFKKINMGLNKLSAFLPVAKAMLDLGPAWLDKYARAILAEALANGLEEGIVNGTGKNMPIGMNRQVGEGVVVTGGVYPLKDTVSVTSLDVITYGGIMAELAKGANGKNRKIRSVIMVINPVDYFKKVMPATTIRTPQGTYVNNVLPYPTDIIQSIHVPVGRAIVGLGNRYFMGIGTAKSGKIEYDDSYRFLEDERIYLVKLYGHGEPLDNNAFMYLDISDLEPLVQEVTVVGTVATKEQS